MQFVCKCNQCQVRGDFLDSPPFELHTMSSPWPFVAWGNLCDFANRNKKHRMVIT